MSAKSDRSTNETERQRKIRVSTKQADIEKNPCTKEQAMSLKCLDENGYDKDKCSKHFQNYKNCREFWHFIMLDRKKKGIEPPMPPAADREQVKHEYRHVMPW